MKIIHVVGARPNFMKIAPIMDAINNHNQSSVRSISQILVHTGQHYDERMSKLFFDDLRIPKPNIDLEVGSASHAEQTSEIMRRFEKVCLSEKPTHILVVGDVNSTIACALVASKLNISIIHVEAGLRSFDRSMPEEINRVLTDAISDYLFITEKSAEENLIKEGIQKEKIHFVGNVMIDTLQKHKQEAQKSKILDTLGLSISNSQSSNKEVNTSYAVLTLHRPSNVDYKENLENIIDILSIISKEIPIVFPIHPRTRKKISEFNLNHHLSFVYPNKPIDKSSGQQIYLINPLGYLDFLLLMSHAKLVLTDSGGMQEETTVLNIPCITLRENTERPVTVTHGTNVVTGLKKDNIIKAVTSGLNRNNKLKEVGNDRETQIPPLWDGKAAERIVKILASQI